MPFFYSTPAGALDFAILCVVVCLGIAFGRKTTKLLAVAAALVFLIDRAAVAAGGKLLPVIAILGCVAATYTIMRLDRSVMARGFTALYLAKVSLWLVFLLGIISFASLSNWATVIAAFQLLIILGGSLDGLSGGRLGLAFDRLGRLGGINRLLASLARVGPISRRGGVSQQVGSVDTPNAKENRGVA
jgi:hypothetical protein